MEFDRAWMKVTGSPVSKLRLTDVLWFYDTLEEFLNAQILSDIDREFLVEVIMECPDAEVDKVQFRILMEQAFEYPMEDILRGSLVKNIDDRDQYTKTMTLKSETFNKLLQQGTHNERESKLRHRIRELESMILRSQISKSKDDRALGKMKDVLINYYKNLVQLIELQGSNSEIENSYIEKLKRGIDKQDALINELKKKVGNSIPNGIQRRIQYYLMILYDFFWKMFRYATLAILLIIVLQLVFSMLVDREYKDDYDDDFVW